MGVGVTLCECKTFFFYSWWCEIGRLLLLMLHHFSSLLMVNGKIGSRERLVSTYFVDVMSF